MEQANATPGTLLTRDEAAEYLRVSKLTLWRLARRDGTFPQPVRIGARVVWQSKALAEWLSKGGSART